MGACGPSWRLCFGRLAADGWLLGGGQESLFDRGSGRSPEFPTQSFAVESRSKSRDLQAC